ncbi:MAG: hypothetical protein ACREDR_43175 [Blastocatellia bacterium]
MIRKTLVLGLVMLCAGVVFAASKSQKYTGSIIDNACAAKHSGDAAAIDAHPVSCALMPPCVKAGYALYSDGKLYKLDASGNKKVEALLKKAPTDQKGFKVDVEGTVSGDTIKVKTITPAT